MPKAVLEFNLPEESGEFKLATKAGAYHSALNSIAEDIFRKRRKFGEFPEEQMKLIQEMEQEFWNICKEYDVDPWE
jgi:hypothetical protein